MARTATIKRETKETQIELSINLDGRGEHEVQTPVPFLDHMLEQIAVHGAMDLKIRASGDVQIDAHHTVEDVGIVLGQAVLEAIGDKKGIVRYGSFYCPLDEALSRVVIDLSGRPFMVYQMDPLREGRIGEFDVELVKEFFQAFSNNAKCNLHLRSEYGENRHHVVESTFKAFARALRAATRRDEAFGAVPSSKGAL